MSRFAWATTPSTYGYYDPRNRLWDCPGNDFSTEGDLTGERVSGEVGGVAGPLQRYTSIADVGSLDEQFLVAPGLDKARTGAAAGRAVVAIPPASTPAIVAAASTTRLKATVTAVAGAPEPP